MSLDEVTCSANVDLIRVGDNILCFINIPDTNETHSDSRHPEILTKTLSSRCRSLGYDGRQRTIEGCTVLRTAGRRIAGLDFWPLGKDILAFAITIQDLATKDLLLITMSIYRFDCTNKPGISSDLQVPPSLMQILEIRLFWQPQVRRHIALEIAFLFCPTIAPIRKPILGMHIGIIEILPAWLSSHVCCVCCAARPQTMNSATRATSVCPTAAFSGKICAWEECIGISDEVICRCFLRQPEELDQYRRFSRGQV